MATSYDVFISYSRRDVEFAAELEAALDGLAVFRDQRAIELGDVWFSTIVDAIYASRLVAVLLSPDFIASPVCKAELFHALGRDPAGEARIVLPVLVRATPVPPALRLLNYVDGSRAEDRRGALAAIRAAVQNRLTAPGGPAAPSPAIDDARLDLAAELRPDAAALVRVLRMARRVLANLEVRAAGYTSATIPATLEIELEDKRSEVQALEERVRSQIG